jgi:hypothetical protein
MPSVARTLASDHPLYSKAELIEHSRNILRCARSFPPGSERNPHRQVVFASRLVQEQEMAWRTHGRLWRQRLIDAISLALFRIRFATQGRDSSGTISCSGSSLYG